MQENNFTRSHHARGFKIPRVGRAGLRGLVLGLTSLSCGVVSSNPVAFSQTAPAARQLGTVKEVSPNKLTIVSDPSGANASLRIAVSVVDGAKVLQLTPGSTDLKSAQAIVLGDIEIGDRVLVTGHQDAPDAFTASRVILMKSTDIAQKHEAEQEDWQKRGMGGLVSSVDTATGTVTITSRSKTIKVGTTPGTVFRRYADGSVKFEDAKVGTIADIQAGDQLRVRGTRSDDGTSINAEEIVTGSFKNLAGTIVSVDAAAETLTLKDLASKRTYAVKVTENSNVRALPPEAAARFAARAKGAQAAGGAEGTAKPVSAAGVAVGDPHSGSGMGSAGMDLSQLINKLPQGSLATLHPGDALMVVASQSPGGGDSVTAITVLSGVEPILAATPKGSASMTLSPWNVSGGPDSGGI
jgi:hypothetical protein